ncbi:MAG TPA: ring-cleaving dioxygenase [Gemmatimonadaceae bacterium]|nr:ring-cleaving dioxygenase [Gemmatimonadaceae bacterium]
MEKLVRSLHHVTATVTDAQEDLDFYTGALGQRLVKKTVNFDNHHVYHFYYGNEAGTPGTIMTTFPYKGMGVRVGTKGAGQITVTSFSVPASALGFWRQRLAQQGIAFRDEGTPFGEEVVRVQDPSGLELRLVGSAADPRPPWVLEDIGAERAIRGIHGVSLLVREPAKTIRFLQEMFDAAVVSEGAGATRVGVNGDAPGHLVEVVRGADAPEAINGLGTVHHVAFAVPDEDAQLRMRDELIRRGFRVTPVMDRQYFKSIYFREPNGVLFEIATEPPGFTADEPLAALGTTLKLPPWEEPHRAAIEAGLPAVEHAV